MQEWKLKHFFICMRDYEIHVQAGVLAATAFSRHSQLRCLQMLRCP